MRVITSVLLVMLMTSVCFGQVRRSEAPPDSQVKITGAVKNELVVGKGETEPLPHLTERVKIGANDATYDGTYEVNGVLLAQIINLAGVAKKKDDGFNRELDLFVQVIGRNGKKAVFSYGELFLGQVNNGIILTQGFRFLYPHKHAALPESWKADEWIAKAESATDKAKTLGCLACHDGAAQPSAPPALYFPKGWCVVATRDSWPCRFVEDVVEVQVMQIPETQNKSIASQTRENMWVENPLLVFPGGETSDISAETLKNLPKIQGRGCSFGLGKGFHGLHSREGYDLADILKTKLQTIDLTTLGVLVTCPDGYRGFFSGMEVFKSGANANVLLLDAEDGGAMKPGEGKFKIFIQSDFYVDRCLRSVAEIRCFQVQ